MTDVQKGLRAPQIKGILKRKVEEWIASIEDTAVQDLVKRDVIVTGGAIASMLLGEEVNDFDIYFRTPETAEAVARYYVGRFQPQKESGISCKIEVRRVDDRIQVYVKSAGIASEAGAEEEYRYFEGRPAEEAGAYVGDVMDDPGTIQETHDEEREATKTKKVKGKPYRPLFVSSNAITLSNDVQIILRFTGEPDVIHENFDFVHCTSYWTYQGNELVLRPQALEALLSRELKYIGSRYPICSLIRIRKFVKRGYSINAGQILKMVTQCQSLDLSDPKVLQEQLTGVDVAYFSQLISELKAKDSTKIDMVYLVEVIDRMF